MKIRNGFVTNSSSTSFIISTKEHFTKASFMKAIGATGHSVMNQFFEDLFQAIDENKQDIIKVMKDSENANDIESFLTNEGYDNETIEIIKKLLDEGRTVFYGKLSSDGYTTAEVYFCCESFILCEENIYFNGSIGGW